MKGLRVTGNGLRVGRVGVLAGGPSNEREISLRSGKAVYNALLREGCDAVFLDVRGDVRDIIREHGISVAFIALHGRFGEDGTVQQMLEDAGVPYTGSGPEASRLALDKIAAKEIFDRCAIPIPDYMVLEKGRFNSWELYPMGLPVVVKPQFEGSSIGLTVAMARESLAGAVDKAFGYGPTALAEKFIDGRELTVGILDDKPLPVIEIVAKNGIYDYTAKYRDPETRYLVPAPIDARAAAAAQDLGRRAHAALGCRFFSRVDMMMDRSGNIFVLEVNTIPGMTERSLLPKAAAAVGLGFNKLCLLLVEGALRAQKSKTTG